MTIKDIVERQLLIMDLLKTAPKSFLEIKKLLHKNETKYGYQLDISQRTFQRDCDDILSIWGVEIKYNKRTLLYHIENTELNNTLDRAIESYNIISALRKKDKIGKYIFLEQRKSSGAEHFNALLHAIENKFIIIFNHTSYWKESSTRKCIAKAIKESQNRFYLIAYDIENKGFRNFGLDRISNLTITDTIIESPYINIEDTYKNAFGIECYETPKKIVLEFDNAQKHYIQSLPLHISQKIIEENKDTFKLRLFIHPTNDFILEIMRHGPSCEVLEPISLREQLKFNVQRLYDKYNN